MDFYKKNLENLKKYRPQLYERINSFVPTGNYMIITSNHPKKYPNLFHKPSNSYVYDNNDPVTPIVQELREKIRLPILNVIFGFGLGYELITMIQNYFSNESAYIVVDPEIEPFYNALKVIDLESIIKNQYIFLFIGEPASSMFLNFRNILMMGNLKLHVKAMNIIDNKFSLTMNPSYFKEIINHLKDAIKEVLLHYGNDPWDSLIGIENIFLNVNEIIKNPGINQLKDKFKGKPGIVVATGPSLNKNIEQLKGLEDKAVICAADASVRVMKRYGLKPHLVTSLERVLATAKLFEGLTKEDVEDVYLSACPVIRPETYANFPGNRIIVYRNFATFQWLEIEKGILDIGPSAANMAFKVLEYLGCNPIILIGQDLAFGENDVTHAKGATFGEKEQQYYSPDRILEVEGNYVPKIKTTDVWYKFLKFYEKDVAEYAGTVINATEGGAKIPGTKIMSFKEVADQYLTNDLKVVDNIKATLRYPTEDEILKYRDMLKIKVNDAINFAEEVIKELNKGRVYTERFQKEIIETYEKTGRFDESLANNLFNQLQLPLPLLGSKKFYEIFMHFVQSYYITSFIEINAVIASSLPEHKKNFSVVALVDDMYLVLIKLIEAMRNSMRKMKEQLG
ncbi:MAG: DUF115 domain-containing protein [Calditerrivibrio sp.]|nr:DUF115 domain-containing protein [Calditerrivibrio sp.]